MPDRWEFWIDVGGTFTDCIGRGLDGKLTQFKTLSSGITKGIGRVHGSQVEDPARTEPEGFWSGYSLRLLDASGQIVFEASVVDSGPGWMKIGQAGTRDRADGTPENDYTYELSSDEEAPILAIRSILGLRLDQAIPPVRVRLGTTRGTNALLTRTGARTAFVTTRGFADVLRIANQDRPRLFDLAIRKPTPLYEHVIEVDERLDANGNVLRGVPAENVRAELLCAKSSGIESLAICLLHAFANSDHEQQVEAIAAEIGFEEISVSSRLSPLIRIVARGDTTTVDAYLNPVLRSYVASLAEALPESELKLMTSAGGLVDASRFVGKDSILSGPAGGVVGFSRAAQAAGFDKSIGFDMGGTSTDVSLFDGRHDLEYETTKAGVRVVAPMLAIETVAAGGGSVCGFDGVKLFVGPASAGAEPGPACYGRGGPLTVTDLNVFLGRIIPDQFPFPLDVAAIDQRLRGLCDEVAASPLGKRYSPSELAEGLLQIANANMVRAIRRVSVAKGYDPADYTLVSFGGAGALHACAMARELGIKSVLIHPFAGILSAYGIGLADVRRFRERSVLRTFDASDSGQLNSIFEELEQQATEDVVAEGVDAESVSVPIRSLDVRYVGGDTTIPVPYPADGNIVKAFEQLHVQHYGYVHAGRKIEIATARVEVVGETEVPQQSEHQVAPCTAVAKERRQVVFNGVQHDADRFLRSDTQPGDEFRGPAILCEPTSTVFVEPGFVASITARNDILLTTEPDSTSETARPKTNHARGEKERFSTSESPDPVRLEIFNNLFAAIAEQMGMTLQKTSFSTNVKERLDFSCAVFDSAGNLVANAPHIPVHLGAMSETVKCIIADNPELAPGDVYVTNDPYRGGSHLPDVTVVTPVHDDEDLIFFTASRAHHAEIGGIVPGSMPPFSTNLSEEGVLIRNFKLVDRGRSREGALRELLLAGEHPTRSVADNLADVSAQVAANNSGARLLNDLVTRYSLPVVQSYMGHIQRAATEKMRLALRAFDDGEYSSTDYLDNGSAIAVTITIQKGWAIVDFAGTGAVLESNLNANRAITTAAVLYVFRCLLGDDIPLNSGVLEPVKIVIPECLLNPPNHPDPLQCAAIVGGNVETSQRIVDTLLRALRVAAASQGSMNNFSFGDDTFGYYETICGGSGATPEANGADAVHTHMTNTRLTDVEVIERRYPIRIREFGIRSGSGGTGQRRGGDGVVREIEFLQPLSVSMLSERRGTFVPPGLGSGEGALPGRNSLRRANSSEWENLGGKFAIECQSGDVLRIETPGGGGYAT